MPDIFDKVRSMAGPAMRGLSGLVAPHVAAGLLTNALKDLPVTEIFRMIDGDAVLWNFVGEEDRVKAINIVREFGGCRWFTIEWAMKAVQKDLPVIASIFLSSDSAYKWLEKQVEVIRSQF